MKYKTTLKCAGCVNAVRKGLDEKLGPDNWSVDLDQPVKYLEVKDEVSLSELKPIFEKLGYQIEA